MGLLRRFEAFPKPLGGGGNEVVEKRGFIRIITVKSALRKAGLRDDRLKRSAFKTLLKEFLFCNPQDPFLRVRSFYRCLRFWFAERYTVGIL